MAAESRSVPGVISILEVYALDELKLRMRWSDASLRSARRNGLKVLTHGKRRYVAGRDILRFLRDQAH
jgi:hypothetical protein